VSGLFSALFSGLLFGAGLLVSGMTMPSKVLGFLDVAGDWDPSLAFVMVGGIGINLVLGRLLLKRAAPLFAPAFSGPTVTAIDGPLVLGAVIFGIGWGLGGYCPGPALVTAAGGGQALLFVGAMLVGMAAEEWVARRRALAQKSCVGDG
jgi:uncharacterized membrane protein YedE/YeeE